MVHMIRVKQFFAADYTVYILSSYQASIFVIGFGTQCEKVQQKNNRSVKLLFRNDEKLFCDKSISNENKNLFLLCENSTLESIS